MSDRKNGKTFDLDAEIASDPPKTLGNLAILDHPRLRDWLARLVELRKDNPAVTYPYMAKILRRGAEQEGIESGKRITPSTISKHIKVRGMMDG